MTVVRKLGSLIRRRRLQGGRRVAGARDELRALTEKFCQAESARARTRRARQLFVSIVDAPTQRLFAVRLLLWLRLLEQDTALREAFQPAWSGMLAELDSVPLFAETGLPGHHALPAEFVRRVFERLLPSAREDCDSGRFIAEVFPNSTAVERFVTQNPSVFNRLLQILCVPATNAAQMRLRRDLRQALSLLAMRVGGRGSTAALRERGSSGPVEQSPFYRLVFATDKLVSLPSLPHESAEMEHWREIARQCSEELEEVHLHMEHEGVSSALVYDLRSIEQTLQRMQLLVAVYGDQPALSTREAVRDLTNTLLRGRLDDMRLRALARDNLTLLARKTVERTGHGGEHYIAHTREGYWAMWRAAAGGGLLTVFTAALKMRIIESHFPLAIEGFLIGTDYAVSFLLLQVFGFALATKQPSMTAATLAGIIRGNRGVARWSKISEFAADISRTQLAAALSNVLAVCLGAVVFEKVWSHLFKIHYLPAESARHVYQTLHPFTSGTAIFAAFTGVLLWLAAVVGGWFENFAVYHRIPEAIVQHPLGTRFGPRAMRRAAAWLECNAGSWSTSIVLGYLLGFSPVVARFFGIPLDVRHVTLSTGTLALAAARFGTNSFEHGWFYYAVAGIAITFVLNLGVSFLIASAVALRAYDVPKEEQLQILRFLFREIMAAPMSFILPREEEKIVLIPSLKPGTRLIREQTADRLPG